VPNLRTISASSLAVVALCLAGSAGRAWATSPDIDWMDLNTFGHYSQSYDPNGFYGLEVIGEADYYHLHNGTGWASGAGSGGSYFAKRASVSVSGSQISYTLDLAPGSMVFNRIDYDSGDHSSNGQLVSVDALVLRATNGSSTAVLSGYARPTYNDYANYHDDRFNFFAAPVGSLVPFSVNYTLTNNAHWTPTTMDSTFSYNLAGTLDFRSAIVPEPAAVAALGLLSCASIIPRRRRRS